MYAYSGMYLYVCIADEIANGKKEKKTFNIP